MEIVMVGVCLLAMGCFFCFGLLKWNGIRYGRKGLPPGTMGWPVFGETTEFLKQGPDFMKHKKARSVPIEKLFSLSLSLCVCSRSNSFSGETV